VTKNWYEKLKEITRCCSWLFRYNLSDRCPSRKFPSIINAKAFKSEMQVKDFKKNNVTIFNPNKSMHGKTLVKMVHKSGHEK
jgi:hypothetical protein